MYLIYHPKRGVFKTDKLKIHHDRFGDKNEDPYIWNDRFLHSYCHITQIASKVNDINFWVSGDKFPGFTCLFCDCVFVTQEKIYWNNANSISTSDSIVDNLQSFNHHYKWHSDHPFKKRRRYTLKAHPEKSFQPQNNDGSLIDIIPYLQHIGIDINQLNKGLTAGFQSKPMKLNTEEASQLYNFIIDKASIKLFGNQIKDLHP